ncbi:Sec-independent protein translocase protein TatB [Saccharospirillum salsuginis]|uniref:Sec-independent protein translocase protein TatB n=1 Tax=Saccharospirillum salsuginis TaxID=418750 RepID=A0A918K2E5_9GAMM|nr:Sec-independent protein translocase protein TatB [Saccharospirillum salsuginis]GGX39674.1 hypothetical protein GCM10007392_02700 [Saccharospirillum salsuginis]
MFDIGFAELMVLAVLALVVVGPERLPVVARSVGRTVGQVKRYVRDLQWQLESEVRGDKKHDPSVMSDEVEPPLNPDPKETSKKDV